MYLQLALKYSLSILQQWKLTLLETGAISFCSEVQSKIFLTLLKTAAISFSSKVRSKNETSVPEDSNAGRSKADAVQRKRSKVPAGAICRWIGRHKQKHKSHQQLPPDLHPSSFEFHYHLYKNRHR